MNVEDPVHKHPYTTAWRGTDIGPPGIFKPEHVDLRDIARSLAMTCRFQGHLDRFYSVAEHSVCCARLARHEGWGDDVVRYALLHDAHEAYCGDLARPNKTMVGYQWAMFENDREGVVREALGLSPDLYTKALVKQIDDRMLHAELLYMKADNRPSWFDMEVAQAVPYDATPKGWDWQRAERMFLIELENFYPDLVL